MLAVVLFAFAVAELTLLTDPGLVGWPARQSCPRIVNGRQREAPTLTPAKVGRLGHAYPPPSLIPAPLLSHFPLYQASLLSSSCQIRTSFFPALDCVMWLVGA